jgi:hypothetical protein
MERFPNMDVFHQTVSNAIAQIAKDPAFLAMATNRFVAESKPAVEKHLKGEVPHMLRQMSAAAHLKLDEFFAQLNKDIIESQSGELSNIAKTAASEVVPELADAFFRKFLNGQGRGIVEGLVKNIQMGCEYNLCNSFLGLTVLMLETNFENILYLF